jgi:hypothetical protein
VTDIVGVCSPGDLHEGKYILAIEDREFIARGLYKRGPRKKNLGMLGTCLASSDLPVVLPQEEMLPENFVCFGPKFDVDRDEIVSSVSTFLQDTYRGW